MYAHIYLLQLCRNVQRWQWDQRRVKTLGTQAYVLYAQVNEIVRKGQLCGHRKIERPAQRTRTYIYGLNLRVALGEVNYGRLGGLFRPPPWLKPSEPATKGT